MARWTPLHTPFAEEAFFYILDGEVLMHLDGEQRSLTAGSFVSVPAGVPHAYLVTSETARALLLITPGSGAMEDFFRAAGEPAAERRLPAAQPLDLEHMGWRRRVGVVGEDVEDHRGAVDHGHVERLFQVALLARQELIVHRHQVGVRLRDRRPQLGELSLAHVAVGLRAIAALGHLAGHGHAGRAEQLAELGQVGLAGAHGDHEGALSRPGVTDALAVARLAVPAVAASVHRFQSRRR